MPRPDIILGRLARIANEKRDLERRLELKDAELVEACEEARTSRTLAQIAEAIGYSVQYVHKITGSRRARNTAQTDAEDHYNRRSQ
jgi:hypothetical protein